MKKRVLSVVLALTMVIGSFNVVFAEEKILIDASYCYAYASAEADDYTGFASTSCYPTDEEISASSSVNAVLYYHNYMIGDSDSADSNSAGTLNVSVELAYYGVKSNLFTSHHSVILDGVETSTNIAIEQ